MQAQPVHEFRPAATRSAPVVSIADYAGATVVTICDSPAFTRKAKEELQAASRDGLACARGLRVALALEGGMGLLIYGIWHLCHLAR